MRGGRCNDLPPRRKREQYVVIAAGGHSTITEESLSDANRRLHPTLTDASTWICQASGEEQPVQLTLSARRLFVPHTGSGWIVDNPYLGITSRLSGFQAHNCVR